MPRDPLPDMPSAIFMGSKPGASVALLAVPHTKAR